jgi:prevent-host-death family protein
MVTVGIRELKQQTSELVRLVREDGQQIQITYRGQVVALMVPVDRPTTLTGLASMSWLPRLAPIGRRVFPARRRWTRVAGERLLGRGR